MNILERLEDDDFYYGEVRKAAISASNINAILEGRFDEPSEHKPAFEIGKYFHCLTLEPEKIPDFEVKDVTRRGKGETYLKTSEVDMCNNMKKSHDAHTEARGILYGPGVEYEVPGITIIDGVLFVGKCDILNPQIGWLGDLKSTSFIQDFDNSIRKWYTAQLWLYYKIFDLPTSYIVTDKKTLETEVIYPDKFQYAAGKAKVLEAIGLYKQNYPEHYQRNLELQLEVTGSIGDYIQTQ